MNQILRCAERSVKIHQNRVNILHKILSFFTNQKESQVKEQQFPQELLIKISLFLHKNCLQFDTTVYLKLSQYQLKISKKYLVFKKQLQFQQIDQLKSSCIRQNSTQLQQFSSKMSNFSKCVISKQNYNFRIIKQWRKTNKNQQKKQAILKNHRHFLQFLKDFDVRYQSDFQSCFCNVKSIKNNHHNNKPKKSCQIIPINNQKTQRELSLMFYYTQTKIINSQILSAMKSLMSNNIVIFQVTREYISNLDQFKQIFIYFQSQKQFVFANKNLSTKHSQSFIGQNSQQVLVKKRTAQAIQFLSSLNLKFNEESHKWKIDDKYEIFEERRKIFQHSGYIRTKQSKTYNFQGAQLSQIQKECE